MGPEDVIDLKSEVNKDTKVLDAQMKEQHVKTEPSIANSDQDNNGGRDVAVQSTSQNIKNVRIKSDLNCTNNIFENQISSGNQRSTNVNYPNCPTKREGNATNEVKLKRMPCYGVCDVQIKVEADDATNHENGNVQNTSQPLPVDPDMIKVENDCTNSGCSSQSQCIQTFECSKCNSIFTEKQMFTAHRKRCTAEPSSVPQNNANFENSQDLRQLIEMVRVHQCLYNANNRDYFNSQLQNLLWAEIATQCNFRSGLNAQAAWNRLIDGFRESLKHSQKKNSKHFKFQNQMEFMLPYVTSSAAIELANNEREQTTDSDGPEAMHVVHQPIPPTKRQRTTSTNLSEGLNTSVRSSKPKSRRRSSSQPLDMFFMSMCETTKNLPAHLQIKVKRRIFRAVIEAEEVVDDNPENVQSTSNNQRRGQSHKHPFRVNSTTVVDTSSSSQED